ncbi:tellurite resistance protein TerC [Hydrogenophaga laconesensis]|uniref:Tellurite resistance protein TerC n=2 Tax=Hydrogenophaga laconesensis TaxID=1805971 RepID=A0ABU1VIL6_9BURK|nr:tellurite resistance protein TerC [Hydrogenophaga laconesensis]
MVALYVDQRSFERPDQARDAPTRYFTAGKRRARDGETAHRGVGSARRPGSDRLPHGHHRRRRAAGRVAFPRNIPIPSETERRRCKAAPRSHLAMNIDSFATGPMWAGFIVFVLAMLALDLFVLGGNKAHRVSVKEAGSWVAAWVTLAFTFAALMWWYLDANVGREMADRKTLEFITGYLIEQTLSVDNMFVFVMIFSYFAVPPELQRRVLLYGVLGAIVMRAGMILAGVWLVSEFAWILYVFGVFLIVTGIKMLVFADKQPDLEKNPLLRWLRAHMRITPVFHGEKFFVRINGVRWATPMFLVLMMIEVSDLVFAVDSIPAIFAVTTDPFIVFTSNIFAIMGLRALYFLLADIAERFHLLKYGLALVLVFIGGKMLAAPWFHMPVQWSLAIVGSVILVSILLSLKFSARKSDRPAT